MRFIYIKKSNTTLVWKKKKKKKCFFNRFTIGWRVVKGGKKFNKLGSQHKVLLDDAANMFCLAVQSKFLHLAHVL